ncbi:MAG: dihydroorotate dehydrogenase electron transfer subunit [archaeon]
MNELQKPEVIPIKKVIEEAEDLKTFVFEKELNAVPGQIVMVWIPEVGEKPFGVSMQGKKEFGITVKKRGSFTERMHELKEGDLVGIRGPYGNGFELKGKIIFCIAGGYGAAPLLFLATEARKKKMKVTFLQGARTKKFLLYENKLKKEGIDARVCTDDGSKGRKGNVCDGLEEIGLKKFDCVYCVGPEKMMNEVVELCEKAKVEVQVSLERHWKCGYGLCGNCCVDGTGERTCVEGPVFSGKKLKKITEFGKHHRSSSGKKEEI